MVWIERTWRLRCSDRLKILPQSSYRQVKTLQPELSGWLETRRPRERLGVGLIPSSFEASEEGIIDSDWKRGISGSLRVRESGYAEVMEVLELESDMLLEKGERGDMDDDSSDRVESELDE